MIRTLEIHIKKATPWLHLVRGLATALMLTSVSGYALTADTISVPVTFIGAGATDCDAGAQPGVGIGVPGVGCFSEWDRLSRKWSDAEAYCSSLGGGYALPSKTQLEALYAAYPNSQINTIFGWMLNDAYVSSTPGAAGTRSHVALGNGTASDDPEGDDYGFVSCVSTTPMPGSCDSGTGVDVPGVGCFKNPDTTHRNWADATSYCSSLGAGFVLPSSDQLMALYNLYPNNQMATRWGWETGFYYWSSTVGAFAESHHSVRLVSGEVFDSADVDVTNVTCVH